MNNPLTFEEIKSGMMVWDNDNKRWQKVLRVNLWESILKNKPNTFYKHKIKDK